MTTDILEPSINTVKTQADVFEAVASIANSGLFNDYMIYEDGGKCWFGGGVLRSVTLYSDRLESVYQDVISIRKATGKELLQALTDELATWKGKWQASGWAGFELAYVLHDVDLLSKEERAGKVALLYLCQPEVAISLDRNQRVIETENNSLEDKVNALLDNPIGVHKCPEGVEILGCTEYRKSVDNVVQKIKKGALEKVILSRKIQLDYVPDFIATWLRGRRENTPSRSFCMKLGGWRASGFSPEIVLSVDKDRLVTTEPLAGTCKRDGASYEDLYRFNDLYRDPKETHEHAISVRLSSSEIQEVCDESSISIRKFMERKERGSVQHLASTVCGRLKEGFNAWDAFASLFPAVTASGIPKISAFKEIRRNESESRGLYAGAILRVDHNGTLEAALVLRSLLGHKKNSWIQAGAGIVSHSNAERELTETSEKLGSIAPWVVKK